MGAEDQIVIHSTPNVIPYPPSREERLKIAALDAASQVGIVGVPNVLVYADAFLVWLKAGTEWPPEESA